MQEYLYFKNNRSALEIQEEEQRKIKKALQMQLRKEMIKKSAPVSKGLAKAGSDSASIVTYSSSTQATVDYANRQLQQKIKS